VRIVLSKSSFSLESFPVVAISEMSLGCYSLRWAKNFYSNLGISEVYMVSKNPLTPA